MSFFLFIGNWLMHAISDRLISKRTIESIFESIQKGLRSRLNKNVIQMWTLKRWKKLGMAYCLLAGAGELTFGCTVHPLVLKWIIGSIYLLAIIASADVKSELAKLSADQVVKLMTLIRCPVPGICF
jgi:hypothetical protein